MPLARNPVYCATKAAVRSFTQTLRYQLRKTNVRVIELQPPAVQTDLHDYMGAHGKQASRVDGFRVGQCTDVMADGGRQVHVVKPVPLQYPHWVT